MNERVNGGMKGTSHFHPVANEIQSPVVEDNRPGTTGSSPVRDEVVGATRRGALVVEDDKSRRGAVSPGDCCGATGTRG